MRSIKTTLYALLFSMAIISCKENSDPDLEKPKVSNLEISDVIEKIENEDTFVLHKGENINLKANLSDNEGLSQYKVIIHFAAEHEHGEHEHERNLNLKEDKKFEFSKIFELNGLKSATIDWSKNKVTSVPENAKEGEYHFHLIVIDINGNETEVGPHVVIEEEGEHDH